MQIVSNTDSTNNTNLSFPSSDKSEITLPPLCIGDIEKLDHLLSYIKERQTEFVDIHSICKAKWGENRLLYLFFAEYLKKNYFTTVQKYTHYSEYNWKHRIAPRGLLLSNFKNEYIRQREGKGTGTGEMGWYRFITSFAIHYLFPFSILIAF